MIGLNKDFVARFSFIATLVFFFAIPPLFLLFLFEPESFRYTLKDLFFWLASSGAVGLGCALCSLGRQSFFYLSLLALASLVFCALNILYAISLYTQGEGFNDAFVDFFHFKTLTLSPIFYGLAFVVLLYFFVVFHLIFYIPPRWGLLSYVLTARRLGTGAIFLCLLSLSVPVVNLGEYMLFQVNETFLILPQNLKSYMKSLKQEIEKSNTFLAQSPLLISHLRHTPTLVAKRSPMNVVWLYVESFERSYFQDDYTSLTPHLEVIRQQSFDFSNIVQLDPIFASVRGMFASQCAVPISAVYDDRHQRINTSFPCLMQVLKKKHYTTHHLGGASMRFGDKEIMVPTGYDSFLTREDIQPFTPSHLRYHLWVYDEGLLAFTQNYYKKLLQNHKPFVLTLFTADNHNPQYASSPICHTLKNFDHLSRFAQAARCTDWTVSRFIHFIRSQPESQNTLIVVMSDHLNPQHNFRTKKDRRLTFFINFPDGRYKTIDGLGTHLDIAPTVLEAMGFKNTSMGLGRSLLSNPSGLLPAAMKNDYDKMNKIAFARNFAHFWPSA